MRKLAVFSLAFVLCLGLVSVAFGFHVKHESEWITFDGTMYSHKNGVRLGYLNISFDKKGLNFLKFRITPLRGTVTLNEIQVVVDGEVAYKHSDKKPLNLEFHFTKAVTKHFEENVRFDEPIKGFNYETGSVVWYFTAAGKKYMVTWKMKDNSITTNTVAQGG